MQPAYEKVLHTQHKSCLLSSMKPSTAPIGLGIAGCGNVFGAYLEVVRRLEQRGQARLAALCGREKQRAARCPVCAGRRL